MQRINKHLHRISFILILWHILPAKSVENHMMLSHLMKHIGKYLSIRIEIPYLQQINVIYVETSIGSIGELNSIN